MVGAPSTRTRLADFGDATLGAFCFGLTIMFQRLVADNGIGAPTALCIRFAVAGLLLVAVSRNAVIMALEAVFAVLLAAVFLGDRVEPLVALGGLAVLAALTAPAVDAERELTPP